MRKKPQFKYPKYGIEDLYMVVYDQKGEVLESEISFKSFKELKAAMKFLDRIHLHFELFSHTFLEKELEAFTPSWMEEATEKDQATHEE